MRKPISVELLEKYLNGDCTEAEVALVKEWYHSFEHEHDYISDAGVIEEKEIEERIYASILNNIGKPEDDIMQEDDALRIETPRYRKLGRWYAAAAVAAVLLGAIYLAIYQAPKFRTSHVAYVPIEQVDITNISNQIYKSVLPDNSMVWLSPGATLRYPKIFDTKARIVTMSGECFFEVTKNPKRPFIINSRSIITKVWGTSFLVRDNLRSNSADVFVITGKVSVAVKHSDNNASSSLKLEKGEIMLYPNQKAIYLVDQHILKPANTGNEPELRIWNRANLSFDGQPLRDIIPVFNSKYHVHIKVVNEKLNHYTLNADFAGFNLPDVLQALKKSINVNYEIKDNNTIELK